MGTELIWSRSLTCHRSTVGSKVRAYQGQRPGAPAVPSGSPEAQPPHRAALQGLLPVTPPRTSLAARAPSPADTGAGKAMSAAEIRGGDEWPSRQGPPLAPYPKPPLQVSSGRRATY
ncbi:uncharacterized protein LOC125134462 [Phacochoerus africanus]|uniref:uncharacterized protein LOC125134462 n=1 Tax=Phacochoerus africanus TaxID=41426 RepID=UPI001FD8C50D|nr:uncharacterized protein LOC125134462 [Phacochoerus africanus]